ncbi:MAG: extracellular solute-binding protein [Clostridiales bacterium]
MLTLKKSILFVCIGFIVFGGLFYVITNTNLIKKDDIKVLTICHPWNEKYEEKNDYLKNIMKKYEKEKNIKIKAKSFDSVNYRETIKLAYKSGEVPDIFIWWGANELKTLVESKKILKLDKYLPDGYKNSMGNDMISLENAKKYIEFDEGLYGIPYSLYVATLFVNEDLFEKNGIDIPATFGELKNCCYYFREKDIEPIAVAGKESWPLQIWYNMLYLIRSDAKSYDETLENSFKSDNKAMILAAEDLLELIEINGFQDDYINKNYNDSLESVLNGKIPMILMGNWVIEKLQNSDGENSSKVIDKMKPIILSKVDKDNNIIEKKDFLGGAIE